jgi:F-type H+-transporting ATPase subunit delta
MSELTTLARPYAVAAFERAKESGATERWSTELRFLADVMSDRDMVVAASNPRVKSETFEASFLDLCGSHIDSEGQNFVRLLIKNRRLLLLNTIATLYEQYKSMDEGYIDVKVYSAFDMSSEEESTLSSALDGFLKKKSRLTVEVDSSLIGGVYIRAGDRVIDASMRGHIEQLKKSLWN